jgi:hypothetical protein
MKSPSAKGIRVGQPGTKEKEKKRRRFPTFTETVRKDTIGFGIDKVN